MIPDHELAVDFIAKWLAEYTEEHHRKTLVVVNNGNLVDTVLNHICVTATKYHSGLGFKCIPNNGICDVKYGPFYEAHQWAEKLDGIVVGSVDRTYGLYARYFRKIYKGIADVFPVFDLEYRDIADIAKKLVPNNTNWELATAEIMLEYCNRVESLYGIITSENPPHTHTRWPYFLQDQKEWIAKIWEREKRTRHKAITKPFPIIPSYICRRNER